MIAQDKLLRVVTDKLGLQYDPLTKSYDGIPAERLFAIAKVGVALGMEYAADRLFTTAVRGMWASDTQAFELASEWEAEASSFY